MDIQKVASTGTAVAVLGGGSMMGGNYAATSDSRFSDKIEQMLGHHFYGAIPIHDRVEY